MNYDSLIGLQKQINRMERSSNVATIKDSATWTYLSTPLTSTSWDGDSYSTTAKTKIDLSSVFSAPGNIKSALFSISIQDSGADSVDCYIVLSPNDTAGSGMSLNCLDVVDRWNRGVLIVPCDSSGDVYYQIVASDTTTMDVYLSIWGYLL